jgi:hypothetical protein
MKRFINGQNPTMHEVDFAGDYSAVRTAALTGVGCEYDDEARAMAEAAQTAAENADARAQDAQKMVGEESERATAREAALTEALADEVARAQDAESHLQADLNDEGQARFEADDLLQANIEAEAAARQSADDAEITARQNAISAEQTARQHADDVLQANIEAEATARENADNAEATARQNADSAEATTRQNADTTLQANIETEATARQNADGAEITARQNADAILQTALAAETTRAISADAVLQTTIANETTRSISADAILQTAIAAETTRAQHAEQTNATALIAEATARDAADIAAITYTGATHILALTKGGGNVLTQALPIAGDTADGLMPKEAHAQLLQNTADIASLSANTFHALGTIPQKTADVTPALLNAFVMDLGLPPKLNYSIKDLDNLTWLCNDITTDPANPAWIQWNDSPVDQATNETLGVVKGDEDTAGKVFVEVDGSLSLIGWDALNAVVAVNAGAIAAEAERAGNAEQANATAIAAETERAQGAEQVNATAIAAEATRAQGAEQTNATAIAAETERAEGAEQTNATAIAAETERAEGAEQANASAIAAETERAEGAEQVNASAIAAETERAEGAEQVNATAIAAEAERAEGAEQVNASAIAAETERAEGAEQVNASAIAAETERAEGAEQTNASAIAAETERAEGAEQTNATAIATRAMDAGVLTDNPGVSTPPATGTATVWGVLQAVCDNLKALDTIQLTDAGADPALPSTAPSTPAQLLQEIRNTLKSIVGGITSYFPDNTLTTENGGLGSDVSQIFTPENAGKLLIIGENGKISSEDSIYLNDSTDEQNTGLKWIDGKARYQKSFSGTFPSSNSYQTYQTLNIPHEISGFGGLRAMMGSFYSVSGEFYLPLEFFISSDSAVDIRIDATNIIVHHRFNFGGNVQYQILLEYTKNE